MRISEAGLAFFKRTGAGGVTEYLTQWSDTWHAFSLVGGHVEPGESFYQCCVREIEEELALANGDGFRVAPGPLRPRFEYTAVSQSAGVETRYVMEIFAAELLTPEAVAQVEKDSKNRWVTEPEIRRHLTVDGKAVSAQVGTVLILAGVLPGHEEYDLFISYSHKDDADGWVTALVATLQADHCPEFSPTPLRLFFDRHDIRDMDDWERRIRLGLKSAKVMLAILSPNYFASKYCRQEWQEYREYETRRRLPGEGIATLYTVPVPAFDADPTTHDDWTADICRRQRVDVLDWRVHGPAKLHDDPVRQRLATLRQRIAERIERSRVISASPTNVPPYSPVFVGRDTELKQVRHLLQERSLGAITAVHGLGGMGKTSLAYHYAHAHADEYPGGRFVVNCATYTDLRMVLSRLEEPLGLQFREDQQKDLDKAAAAIRAELERRNGSLLILDNVERGKDTSQPDLLDPAVRGAVLPDGAKVHVLVTTREDPPAGVVGLALDGLKTGNGLELLRYYRDFGTDPDAHAAARGLVERLGGHPLSLEVVGVFLWRTPEVSYRDFLTGLETDGIAAMDETGADDRVKLQIHTVKVVSRLLEPTLAKLTPAEVRALEFAALMPSDWVVRPWLKELVGAEFPDAITRTKAWKPDPWRRLEEKLLGWRLLFRAEQDEPQRARIHPVLQEVLRGRMASERTGREDKLIAHTEGRGKILIDRWVDQDSRWEIEPINLLAMGGLMGVDSRFVKLANRVSHALSGIGRFNDMQTLLRQAVRVVEVKPNIELVDKSAMFANLGEAELKMGKLGEARLLLQRAIEIGEQPFLSEHPALGICYSNLGEVELILGKMANARQLLQNAIRILESSDPKDSALGSSYCNLGKVEWKEGNFPEARRLYQKAIQIQEIHLPPDHPMFATCYSHMGCVEQSMGNLIEARWLFQRAIQINEKQFPDHPELAIDYSNLGNLERELGNLAEARQLCQRAVQIQEKNFPPDHPNLAISYTNLGVVERVSENLAAARRLFQRAFQIEEKNFPPDHPDLAISYTNLGAVEQALGNLAEAQRFLKRAIQIQEKNFPSGNPNLVPSYSLLGVVEQELGNRTEGRRLYQRAIRIEQIYLGPDHPNLASKYWWLGILEEQEVQLAEARDLVGKAHRIFLAKLGADHTNTKQTASDLKRIIETQELLNGDPW
jgi:tetratricopeptide (TPR) repeat protein